MTVYQLHAQSEDAGMALVRAASTVIESIRTEMGLRPLPAPGLKPATELVACEEAVKVCGDWYGFGGLDEKGRMVLWAEGYSDPFLYGPTVGESFIWRPLIGDAS